MVQIFVRDLHSPKNSVYTIDISLDSFVEEFKTKIAEKNDYPTDRMSITIGYHGSSKYLHDGKTLEECGLKDMDSVLLRFRFSLGPCPTCGKD